MTGNLWTLINTCLFKDQGHWNLIEQVSNVIVYQLAALEEIQHFPVHDTAIIF